MGKRLSGWAKRVLGQGTLGEDLTRLRAIRKASETEGLDWGLTRAKLNRGK